MKQFNKKYNSNNEYVLPIEIKLSDYYGTPFSRQIRQYIEYLEDQLEQIELRKN